jgi:hypothetical protein
MQENPMKQTPRFEQDGDGWWASRTSGKDNILGHGSTKEEALADLEHQVAGFLVFLKEHRKRFSGVAKRTPTHTPRLIS